MEQLTETRAMDADWKRALFEAIDDAVFVHDLEGRILEANPAACRRLGYSRDELLLMHTRDIDADEFAGGFVHRLKRQLVEGHLRCEGKHRSRDGRIIEVDINTSLIQRGGQLAVLAVMRDISERKQAEQRQQAQYAVARILAEGKPAEETAGELIRQLADNLGYDVGAFWVVRGEPPQLKCQAWWIRPGLTAAEFMAMTRRIGLAPGAGLPGRAWDTGLPQALTLSGECSGLDTRTLAGIADGLSLAHAFPIQVGSQVFGVLEFLAVKSAPADPDAFALIESLALQIGQALDRQRMAKALRDSEAVYHSLVESLPQNIFRKDRAGRVTFGNERYCATLKMPLSQLLGKTDFDLFPAELASKYVRDDQRVLDTGATLETVEEHRLPDGSKIYVQVVKTPVYDAHSAIVGTQGIFWDVSEQHRAAELLADSERRYRQLTEATLDAIVLIDAQQRILLFNPAAERMFGYAAADAIGQKVTLLMPAEYHEAHERGFSRYLQTGVARMLGRTMELQGRRRDGGDFPVEIALSVVAPAGGDSGERRHAQFLAAFRDLTERNKMRSVLVLNEKLASIGLLSAGVAHEINNPLAFVANNLAVLDRDFQGFLEIFNLYETVRDHLRMTAPSALSQIHDLAEEIDLAYVKENLPRLITRTREGVERVTRIVQSLRGLARTDPPRRQEVHVPDLIAGTLEILQGRFKRSAIAVEQVHDAYARISCVSTQIHQVLLNLLLNAFQSVESFRKEGGIIRISSRRLADEFLIEVADNGCGIEADHLPKLFDPFFTTKDVGDGTGLGLSISHNIVAGHGGRIEVESLPGRGAVFRVFLPLEPGS